jgi:plasmid maintenance system killer protein
MAALYSLFQASGITEDLGIGAALVREQKRIDAATDPKSFYESRKKDLEQLKADVDTEYQIKLKEYQSLQLPPMVARAKAAEDAKLYFERGLQLIEYKWPSNMADVATKSIWAKTTTMPAIEAAALGAMGDVSAVGGFNAITSAPSYYKYKKAKGKKAKGKKGK